MNISDRTIVITGASKGLGREIAFRLCRQNPNLVLIARIKTQLEQVQAEIEILAGKKPMIIAGDISNESDVNRIAETIKARFKHIDVLVNNAGIGIHKTSEKLTNKEMRRQFEVNFYGVFYCTKALLPLLKSSNFAYILNIDSLVSLIPFADNSVYAATKSALVSFSVGLRHEMKEHNITVGLFFPGLINTSFQHDCEDRIRTPAFLILNPQKVAIKLEKMILKRRKNVYMYRWMLFIMKLKQLF